MMDDNYICALNSFQAVFNLVANQYFYLSLEHIKNPYGLQIPHSSAQQLTGTCEGVLKTAYDTLQESGLKDAISLMRISLPAIKQLGEPRSFNPDTNAVSTVHNFCIAYSLYLSHPECGVYLLSKTASLEDYLARQMKMDGQPIDSLLAQMHIGDNAGPNEYLLAIMANYCKMGYVTLQAIPVMKNE